MKRSGMLAAAYTLFDELVWIAALNGLLMLFTLLGGVVFGLAPSTVAASALVRKRHSGEHVRMFPEFWGHFRREFVRANTIGVPVLIALVALGLSWHYFTVGADVASAVISGVALVVFIVAVGIVAIAVPLYCNYEIPASRVIPSAVAFALTNPLLLLLALLVIAAGIGVTFILPGLLPFFTFGSISYLTTRLSLDFFVRNEKRLAEAAPTIPSAAR
ncbi:MAG TPA: DUF624 domain-containing protein [Glaciihabitans sp.]|jgi:uncharacterized membrane protein YesL|nr:DUF624 domain-containing protein [Glaciihabitans sp.]